MAEEKINAPLIRTKLHRPPVASDHLHRQHLLDRLDHRRYHPLTLDDYHVVQDKAVHHPPRAMHLVLISSVPQNKSLRNIGNVQALDILYILKKIALRKTWEN